MLTRLVRVIKLVQSRRTCIEIETQKEYDVADGPPEWWIPSLSYHNVSNSVLQNFQEPNRHTNNNSTNAIEGANVGQGGCKGIEYIGCRRGIGTSAAGVSTSALATSWGWCRFSGCNIVASWVRGTALLGAASLWTSRITVAIVGTFLDTHYAELVWDPQGVSSTCQHVMHMYSWTCNWKTYSDAFGERPPGQMHWYWRSSS